jgi:hypothetical protein
MSTATLNIWITKMGDPCRIEDTIPHFVYVLYCNGEPLVWCKKLYVGMQTTCGHLEVEVPPGCYVVGAVQGQGGLVGHPPSLGNYLTHIAIVRANCGDHVCVTLFDPSFHFCGTWLGSAINTHLHGGGQGLPENLVAALRNAAPAVDALVKAAPQDAFVLAQAKALAQPTPKP